VLGRQGSGASAYREERVLIVGTSASATRPGEDDRAWTIWGLVAAHKLATLAGVAVCAALVAMIAVAALGPKGGAVTDATSCSQWGSANQDRQSAYARRYIKEHGVLAAAGTAPASVITAINNGCMKAFSEDVSDSVNVVQAISGNF
jgi:hypothetical protein